MNLENIDSSTKYGDAAKLNDASLETQEKLESANTADTSNDGFKKTPDWILNDITVGYNRSFNRVETLPVLEITKKTEFPSENKILKMSLLSQWPKNPFGLVLFELAETKTQYEQMEEDMNLFYNNRLSNRANFPDLKIAYGMHVVYFERMRGKVIYKRAKIIKTVSRPGETNKSVVIRLVDYNYNITVNSLELLFLYEQFSTLPPRAYKFKLEGMKSYKKYFSYKRLLHHDSGIWSETMEVTKSNDSEKGVIIFTDWFPRSRFPYGVNGFIILRLIEELTVPVLSEINNESKAFIVYANSNAEIFIQFPTPFYHHYSKLWTKILKNETEEIRKKAGKISLPVQAETILLAPHYNSDGSYYRAVCIQQEVEPSANSNNVETQIKVKFLEYGDEAFVNVSELVLAEDVNHFLSILPPMAVPAKLAEIDTLNTNKFWQLVNQNISYAVKVCGITSDGKPEVKLLRYKRSLEDELKMLHLDNSLLKNIEEPAPMGRYNVELAGPIDPNCTVPHDILSTNGLGKECRRLRVGMNFTFIVQLIHVNDKTVSLYTLGDSHDKLMKIEKEMEVKFPQLRRLIPHKTTCAKGNYFMVKSRILGKVVRAMMLGLSKSKRYDIEVLLVDYGIREEVQWAESCRSLRVWEHCMLSSYGVVATIRNEDIELGKFMEDLQEGHQVYIAGKILSVKIVDSIPSAEIEVLKFHVEK